MASEPVTPKSAFGVPLTRDKNHVSPYYCGYRDGLCVVLWQKPSGYWEARLEITSRGGQVHFIEPSLSSLSPTAALRSLRGTLGNLVIDLQQVLGGKRR